MSKKIKITIDGKIVETTEGMLLLHAIRNAGVHVPSLCHTDSIEDHFSTCRVCTVNINGTPEASCTKQVSEGMDIQVNTPELQDARKAMVEMLFSEGNHFCPACEKSGDCELQGLGYRFGVSISRYPHLHSNRLIDFSPKRMIVETNRCILCRRCVEQVVTDNEMKVFSFKYRGIHTVVSVDKEQEAKLNDEQLAHAMHICPTGAILVRGKSFSKPFGDRRFDVDNGTEKEVPLKIPKVIPKPGAAKKVVATTSLAGCFGCHMSMLDCDTEILDIVELVEFNRSPITDIKEFTKRADIGIVEGGCCNTDNVEVLREFRKKCDVLVVLGECAVWGGLPAMRNTVPLRECMEEAYLHSFTSENDASVIPHHEDIPKILDKVYGCSDVVEVDYFIPGCPPSPELIWKMVKNILFNKEFAIQFAEFKYD